MENVADIDVELWGDLVVSILSVNNYTLDKVYRQLPDLRREGLCSIRNLGGWQVQEISQRIARTGMNRSAFMNEQYAKKLSSLGVAISRSGVLAAQEVLLSKNREAISKLLLPIHGIGPRVVTNFLVLRGILN